MVIFKFELHYVELNFSSSIVLTAFYTLPNHVRLITTIFKSVNIQQFNFTEISKE